MKFEPGLQTLRGGGGAVLDFSCGSGAFTNQVNAVFPTAKVFATDFHEERPMGLNKNILYFAHDTLPSITFDFIILRHVLEHVDNPTTLLKDLNQMVTPGGIIYIEVPNRRSFIARVCRSRWVHWYMPRHLHHFDSDSLAMVLDLTSFTGIIRKAELPSMGVQLAEFMKLKRYPLALKLFGAFLQPLEILLEKSAGQSNTLFVIAKKVCTDEV